MLGFDRQEVKGSSQGRPAWLLWPAVVAENGGPSGGKPPRGPPFSVAKSAIWGPTRPPGGSGRVKNS